MRLNIPRAWDAPQWRMIQLTMSEALRWTTAEPVWWLGVGWRGGQDLGLYRQV